MPKRSSKKDVNQVAANIVAIHTGQPVPIEAIDGGKNPAAVYLGHLGGIKGGAARAKALTPKRRKQIAKDAAAARWKKKPEQT
jgi:hypothetical protein